MCLQILLHTMKEWFGHSNCQSTFFFVIRKRRIQKWFLPILPLIQSQGEKILNKSLLRERSMIVQIGFHLLEHFLRGLDCQSPLLLFCGGWLIKVGGENLGEIFAVCHFRVFALHQPSVERFRNQSAEIFHRFHEVISFFHSIHLPVQQWPERCPVGHSPRKVSPQSCQELCNELSQKLLQYQSSHPETPEASRIPAA